MSKEEQLKKKNAFPLRVTEPWNPLPEYVIQAKSINTFKNHLDQFWSNQAVVRNFEAHLKIGTGILKPLINNDEDVIRTILRYLQATLGQVSRCEIDYNDANLCGRMGSPCLADSRDFEAVADSWCSFHQSLNSDWH